MKCVLSGGVTLGSGFTPTVQKTGAAARDAVFGCGRAAAARGRAAAGDCGAACSVPERPARSRPHRSLAQERTYGLTLASANATIQAGLAVHFGGNYGLALALVVGSVAVVIAILASFGNEAKGVTLG